MPTTPTAPISASFERPVRARLVVVPEHGEPWDASPADLWEFGYVSRIDAMQKVRESLRRSLGEDWESNEAASFVRYIVGEYTLLFDHEADPEDYVMLGAYLTRAAADGEIPRPSDHEDAPAEATAEVTGA
jgi:hypothetical protein